MTLVLDRYFVHRLRVVTGKDGDPLNEVGPPHSRGRTLAPDSTVWEPAPAFRESRAVAYPFGVAYSSLRSVMLNQLPELSRNVASMP
jgi:hypothetical protein